MIFCHRVESFDAAGPTDGAARGIPVRERDGESGISNTADARLSLRAHRTCFPGGPAMPFLRNEHGQIIRKDGSLMEPAPRRSGPRRTEVTGGGDGKPRRVSHLRVDKLIGGAGPVRDEYERLVEDPNTLLKDLAAWFKSRGHPINLAAIRRHRNRHLEQFRHVREAAREAAAFCETINKRGPGGSFVEAAQGHFEMKLMQHMSRLRRRALSEPRDWESYAKTLRGAAAGRRDVEQTREAYRRRVAEAARACEQAVKTGATGKEVVARMREILGV
jgi:hypothetical protein